MTDESERIVAEINARIGAMIYEWRTARGMTQRGLAELLGLTNMIISRAEAGSGNLSLESRIRLALALGYTRQQLARVVMGDDGQGDGESSGSVGDTGKGDGA